MLPGKRYKPEDYVEIVWRRKWVWILPFVIMAAGTFIGTQFLPNRYRSEARILVVPQQVPRSFVQPTVTSSLNARLQAISQQLQSRTRLERIIQEVNLYQEARSTMTMEEVVERMRRDISIRIPSTRGSRGEPGSFTVGFVGETARVAQQVTERLASQFITESLQDRTVQADQTNQFLQTQLEEARRNLAEHEQKFAQFRRKYAGALPTQVPSNLAMIQSRQAQLQNLADTINRDRDRQLVLDRIGADLLAFSAAREPVTSSNGTEPVQVPAANRLEAARVALRALQLRLKPEHPDMIRAERAVRELEQRAAAEELNAPVGTGIEPARSAGLAPVDQKRLSDMRAERESLDRRIALNQAEEVRLQRVLSEYGARVEAAPGREAEETEMMRDYDTLDEQYRTLLGRTQQSKIAADLERRQIGEQFKLIDPARLPELPISPDRASLNTMGAMAGLAIGLALIALLEYRNTSFRTDDDVTLSLALPVLAVIPAMITRREHQRTKRRRRLAMSASLVAMTGAVAVIVWKMDDIANWVR
ncbi:MAG: tyrosine kinase [Chloroflexi bacterium]|nr:tyrosine kinase [Chloroflexota bacterium]